MGSRLTGSCRYGDGVLARGRRVDERLEATHVGGHDKNGAKQVLEAIWLVILVHIVIAEQFKHAGNPVSSKGRRQQWFRADQGAREQAGLTCPLRKIRPSYPRCYWVHPHRRLC